MIIVLYGVHNVHVHGSGIYEVLFYLAVAIASSHDGMCTFKNLYAVI